jgi:hypothetical protein
MCWLIHAYLIIVGLPALCKGCSPHDARPPGCSLIPDDNITITTRKETEYVRDQWDIFSYAYPPTPKVNNGTHV